MREEYNISALNPRRNPYAAKLNNQITVAIDADIVEYFKSQADSSGIPYQRLINLYLTDCVEKKRQLQVSWS